MPSLYTYINGKGGIKEVLQIAIPMVISMAADTLMAFTDRLFLSKLSPEHMNAAMGGALGAQMLTFFFIGLTGFSTALVAQLYGSKKYTKCPSVLYQSLLIITAAVPIILLLKPASIWFFEQSVVSKTQLGLQEQYFNILIYGCFVFMLRHILSCYFSGIGKTKIIMYANLLALLSNVGLSYILIFGKLGFKPMGIEGAAIGSISAMTISSVVLLAQFFFSKYQKQFAPLSARFWDKELMKQLLKFGSPAGVEMFVNFGLFVILIHIFYSHSPEVATATSILFNWDAISFIPLIGVEIAVTSLVGRYIGEKKLAYAHRSTVSAIIAGTLYSFTIFIFFVSIPELLSLTFKPDVESGIFNKALPTAVFLLRVSSIYVLSEAIMLAFIGALRGAGDTVWSMFASIILHSLFVGIGFLMLKVFEFSVETTWVTIVFSILLFALVFYLRYKSGKWKNIKVVSS